jgi:hypothetical protein
VISDRERARRMTEYLEKTKRLIAKHGWMVQGVFGDDPAHNFAYTVGLAGKGKPEFIVFGLRPDIAQQLLNELAGRQVDGGETFTPGQLLDDLFQPKPDGEKIPARLLLVMDSTEHLTMANRFGPMPVTALQLCYPDADGYWPWESQSKLHGLPVLGLP